MADNLTVGHTFDGESGLKTGANLEDLVSLARFTSNAFDGNATSLFDGDTIDVDANGNAKVGDASIGDTQLENGISGSKLTAASVPATALASGAANLTGEIKIWSTGTAPSGWLECDGDAIDRTTYATLFGVIGETFGQGDNATTFNIPDFRGRFLRGWDHSIGRDPDRASRTAMNTGGNTADNVGSVEAEALKSHSHTASHSGNDTGSASRFESTAAAETGTLNTNATGGNETRPVNANVMYIIKT